LKNIAAKSKLHRFPAKRLLPFLYPSIPDNRNRAGIAGITAVNCIMGFLAGSVCLRN
jgi:hypothetical protein